MQSQPRKSCRALAVDAETALGDAKYSRRVSSVEVSDGAPDIRRRTPIVYKESVVAGASYEEV
jgi:hypothetical protein